MLEMFICLIPEELGWALVGVVATLCVIIGYIDIKIICQMVKDRLNHDDDIEDADYEEEN
jgi:hypothetical protein